MLKEAAETKPEEKAADKSQDPVLKEAAETKPEEKAADKSQDPALKEAAQTKPEEKAADKSQDPVLKEAAETKPEEKAADKSQDPALKEAAQTKPEEKAADKSQDPALKEAAETKPEEKAADKSQALALKDTDAKSRLVVPRGFTSVTRFSFMSQCKLYPVFASLVPDLFNCNMSKSWSYSFTLGLPQIRHTALLAIHELLNGVSIFQACYLLPSSTPKLITGVFLSLGACIVLMQLMNVCDIRFVCSTHRLNVAKACILCKTFIAHKHMFG